MRKHNRRGRRQNLSGAAWAGLGVGTLILLGGGAALAYTMLKKKTQTAKPGAGGSMLSQAAGAIVKAVQEVTGKNVAAAPVPAASPASTGPDRTVRGSVGSSDVCASAEILDGANVKGIFWSTDREKLAQAIIDREAMAAKVECSGGGRADSTVAACWRQLATLADKGDVEGIIALGRYRTCQNAGSGTSGLGCWWCL